MSKFDRLIATTVRLIGEYGATCTWTKQTDSTPDNSKPWKTVTGSPTPYTVKLVRVRKGQGWANAFIHLIQGSDIPAGKPKALMAAGNLTFVPDNTDVVTMNGVDMKIDNIDPVAPNGLPIIYIITFA